MKKTITALAAAAAMAAIGSRIMWNALREIHQADVQEAYDTLLDDIEPGRGVDWESSVFDEALERLKQADRASQRGPFGYGIANHVDYWGSPVDTERYTQAMRDALREGRDQG
jgi:hypothetical protein